MAKPELGTKRQCQSCGAKFYDLHRNPITCPKCGAIFEVIQPKTNKGPNEEEEAELPSTPEADLVPLETADADAAKITTPDGDIEVEETGDEDDTFLEEDEEEGDDVSGLIDGEIEDDEEA